MTEQEILEWAKAQDLETLLWAQWPVDVKREYGEDLSETRWHMYTQTVFELENGVLVGVEWRRGLTEYQDNQGPYKVYIAEPYTHTETRYRAKSE